MLFERSEFIECFEKIGFRPLRQDVFAPFFVSFLSVTKEMNNTSDKKYKIYRVFCLYMGNFCYFCIQITKYNE